MTTLHKGTLFTVRFHADQDGYGFCGSDTPPTAGDVMICAKNYSLVLASSDDLDDNGDLQLADGLTSDDVSAEPTKWSIGEHESESDGTASLVCVAADVFARTA
jgi:hypothetical protein